MSRVLPARRQCLMECRNDVVLATRRDGSISVQELAQSLHPVEDLIGLPSEVLLPPFVRYFRVHGLHSR